MFPHRRAATTARVCAFGGGGYMTATTTLHCLLLLEHFGALELTHAAAPKLRPQTTLGGIRTVRPSSLYR